MGFATVRKTSWRYKAYVGTVQCSKCGLPGYQQEGTIMGQRVDMVQHRVKLSGRNFVFKVCYV